MPLHLIEKLEASVSLHAVIELKRKYNSLQSGQYPTSKSMKGMPTHGTSGIVQIPPVFFNHLSMSLSRI